MAEFGNLPTIEPVIEKLDGKTVVTLGTVHFTEGNAAVRAALEDADVVELRETFAQRYLGCGMPVGKRLEIHGVPGNDMACYMDGGEIEVFGNAQDQVANTMNDGDIVIHGRVGRCCGLRHARRPHFGARRLRLARRHSHEAVWATRRRLS